MSVSQGTYRECKHSWRGNPLFKAQKINARSSDIVDDYDELSFMGRKLALIIKYP